MVLIGVNFSYGKKIKEEGMRDALPLFHFSLFWFCNPIN